MGEGYITHIPWHGNGSQRAVYGSRFSLCAIWNITCIISLGPSCHLLHIRIGDAHLFLPESCFVARKFSHKDLNSLTLQAELPYCV